MKPNILLITSDQQHYMTLGSNNIDIKTPNLDRLAKLGMTSNRSYCPNPTCTPTRASIITGQYPSQHGAWSLGTKLDESKCTLGDILSDEGYETTLVGKAHFQPTKQTKDYESIESSPVLQDLDFWREYKKKFYGFQNIELLRNHTNEWLVGQHYAIWLEEKEFDNWRDYFLTPTGNMKENNNCNPIKLLQENNGDISKLKKGWGNWKIPLEAHYNQFISERTNDYIDKAISASKPFMIWASFPDPHPDYFVPEPYASMYNPDELTLHTADGKEHNYTNPIVSETQKLNPNFEQYNESGFHTHGLHSHIQDESSLRQDLAWYYGMVTFMDEHIGKILDKLEDLEIIDNTLIVFTTDHGHYIGQHGLIRKGPFHYEDALKIPFIVSYPQKIVPNWGSEALNTLVDLAPTILDIVGIDIPHQMTGVSQKDVWYGLRGKARNHVICENRHEESKLHARTYIDSRYKLTVYQGFEFGDIFDLKNDPKEIHNLWDDENFLELKVKLLKKFIDAEFEKEIIQMPRIANA